MKISILKYMLGDHRVIMLPPDKVYIEVSASTYYFDVPELNKDSYFMFKKITTTSLIKELFDVG